MNKKIEIKGARVHNLKNINVDIPLNQIVGIAGVSGSGKSSLALGVLYGEGSRRYLDALSTYTRRRLSQSPKADVDEVLYVPAALALHQRPAVPGIRSTFATSTELLNSLRLLYSRCGSHCCPNGHYLTPTLEVARGNELICPVCGEHFQPLSAEEFSFNSQGACPCCQGIGTVRTVDRKSLIPDENLTIEEGAVAPWNSLMWSLMSDVAKEMGVRVDVPFKDLSEEEKHIVYDGPMVKKHIFYHPKKNKDSNNAVELDFTYYSATATVLNALNKAKDENGMKRVEKFLKEETCPQCGGSRFSDKARKVLLNGISLADLCKMSLSDALNWVKEVPASLPEAMRPMAENIIESFEEAAQPLMALGLGYITLERTSSTLSTGERQRVQLARAVRNRTTGIMYVLDEPSIGLHPANIEGLNAMMDHLISDGNSVILVDHDCQVLKKADYLIEMGPKAGEQGGQIIAQGTVDQLENNPQSKIGPFLKNDLMKLRCRCDPEKLFDKGTIHLSTKTIHTVKPLQIDIPVGRLTVVTGVSGSGKTTMVLESLVPALQAKIANTALPQHVSSIQGEGIDNVKLIDATPIGINVRSTVATYANVHDELRKLFAKTAKAKELGYSAGDFSYNTGKLRCSECDGTGEIDLDVQFLPDVSIPCPVCHGSRYSKDSDAVALTNKDGQSFTISQIMEMSIDQALEVCKDYKVIYQRLEVLQKLGLGYLSLGEQTPSLSGGEAQRLKLAFEMGKLQSDSVFVFDEPTIGLHPLDVQTLMNVFETLIDNGATIIVIEHDLDVIGNADYLIDMGPGGGESGGRIVCAGTPEQVKACGESITGKYLK